MANRIKGLTVETDGSTTGLDKALKNVNTTIRGTQTQLKDVQKLLKLDPSNTELLSQKQRLLKEAITPFEPNRAPARCLSNFCIIIEGCPSPGQSFFVLFPCFHLTVQMRSILFSNPVFSFTLVKTT